MPQTIAILSPGDMGHSVGRELGAAGHRVITCLAGRSERTRGLSAEAGISGCLPARTTWSEQADLVMSILVPSEAEALAGRVAAATQRPPAPEVTFADCNAVSPATSGKDRVGDRGSGEPVHRRLDNRAAAGHWLSPALLHLGGGGGGPYRSPSWMTWTAME